MRYSQLFARTKRDAPADITDPVLRLAYRAGMAQPMGNGSVLYFPLAVRALARLEQRVNLELDALGAQELRGLPLINPDVLAATEIQSYKQLPARVAWHSGGMARLHVAGFEANAEAASETQRVLEGVAARLADYAEIEMARALDGTASSVWYSTLVALDLELLKCTNGRYAATRSSAAPFILAAPEEAPAPLQEIETPHCDTIDALARFLNIPSSRTAKAVFYSSDGRVIFAVIRGDLQINEGKLKRALGISELRFATDDEIARVGATPGYASPIGTRGATIIVDPSVARSPNLVAGANKVGYHFLNTNVPRDYKPDLITDIALARPGDRCPDGEGDLEVARGIRLGALHAPRALSSSFLDANGKAQKPFVVELELDLGALLLAHIGAHHDEKGIVWSRALAPFDVYIVALSADKPEVAPALERVLAVLNDAHLSYLLDDRNESAGVKFNDADLIGMPLRITVGPKTVAQNSVELKARTDARAALVSVEALAGRLAA